MAKSTNEIRASYTSNTIRVYQAFSFTIANKAISAGKIVSPPFKMERMTWIKPSFLWMMYRSGWGRKDSKQTKILGIDLSHQGFQWALRHSILAKEFTKIEKNKRIGLKKEFPVRIQWDPERNILLEPLDFKTIQIGLSGEAVHLYVNEWIKKITDVTPLAHEIHSLIRCDKIDLAKKLLPQESFYHIDQELSKRIDTNFH